MPDLARAVVDAVWRSHQSVAKMYADPLRLLAHPKEIFAFMSRTDRNLNDSAQPYDEGFLKEFRDWRRATAASTGETASVDGDFGEGTPRREREDVAYLRDRLLRSWRSMPRT